MPSPTALGNERDPRKDQEAWEEESSWNDMPARQTEGED
jgi:hypothetical protein